MLDAQLMGGDTANESADHLERKRAHVYGVQSILYNMFVEILKEHIPERPLMKALQQLACFFVFLFVRFLKFIYF